MIHGFGKYVEVLRQRQEKNGNSFLDGVTRGFMVSDESAATAGHPARDGDCEKIRAGNSAAARRVSAELARRESSFLSPFAIAFRAVARPEGR